MSDTPDLESVDIPSELLLRIQNRVDYTEFEDANQYIIYVLEEVIHSTEQETELSHNSDVDEHQVEERLESLGYLNE
ncbi:hypothetical protein [Halorientalis litorea]|uniref:hypothetical protein n=1 Tax=Halorientalis litorea TaxID=2931977 RepID=UPI001FF579CE|nr:hypothetical protein [Halorientalis litorea]